MSEAIVLPTGEAMVLAQPFTEVFAVKNSDTRTNMYAMVCKPRIVLVDNVTGALKPLYCKRLLKNYLKQPYEHLSLDDNNMQE